MDNSSNILKYIIEFMKITEGLLTDNPDVNLKKGEIYIEQDELNEILEVNDYALPEVKLKIWRALNLIKAEKDRFGKKIRIDDKFERKIALNLEAYFEIKSVD